MSYFDSDEVTEIDELNEKIDNLQSQLLNLSVPTTLENNETGQSFSPGSNPGSRIAPKDTFSTDLGDISGAVVIDFNNISSKNVTANVLAATQITFANIPPLLTMSMRLYIRSADPVITIDGTIVSGTGSSPLITTVSGDFLDLSLESIDQVNVTVLSSKKNDESLEAPGIPLNVQVVGNSPSTIKIIWDNPDSGSLPITYDIAFSESPAGNSTDGPDTHATGSPDEDISGNIHEITGLDSATPYYIWIKAVNEVGSSEWLGPIQTNTEGITNPGGVNFAIPGGSVLWNSVTVNFDAVAGAFYTVTRTNVSTGEVEILQDNDSSAGPIVDNVGIEPETDYDYKMVVKNGFGAVIGTATINIDTPAMPAPTVVFEAVGTRLKFTVTLPANVNIAYIEWSTSDSVDGNGFFNAGSGGNRQIARPVGVTGETDVIHQTDTLNASTLYYGHAKLQKNQFEGEFSSIDSDTTSAVSPPSKPSIDVTSPGVGEVRIKLDFNDATSTGEKIVVQYRLQSSVGPYTLLDSYERDNPPSDDLDPQEDEIEVIRGGFTPGESYTFRAEAVNQSGPNDDGTDPDFDNVLIDS